MFFLNEPKSACVCICLFIVIVRIGTRGGSIVEIAKDLISLRGKYEALMSFDNPFKLNQYHCDSIETRGRLRNGARLACRPARHASREALHRCLRLNDNACSEH